MPFPVDMLDTYPKRLFGSGMTMGQVSSMTDDDILAFKGVGPGGLARIRCVLAAAGLYDAEKINPMYLNTRSRNILKSAGLSPRKFEC